MAKSKSPRHLMTCLILISVAVVFADAFGAIFVLVLLASVVLSLATLPLAIYAIGFTDIRTSMIAITVISIVLSVWTSHWPTNLRFQSAKSQFEEIANDVRKGHVPDTPAWVGTYRVKKIEWRQPDSICFWTNLHPNGYTGIIKCSEDKLRFNIATQLDLGENWHLLSED